MSSIRKKIADLIAEIEEANKDSNVVKFQPIEEMLPANVKAHARKINQENIALLKQVLINTEECRTFITNRALEEMSHAKYNKLCDKMAEFSMTNPDIELDGWAENWMMVFELGNVLDDYEKNKADK